MITQSFKNGETELRFESAESLIDAEKNGFAKGVFNRFFVNEKPVDNYMAMVRHIIDETQRSGKRFIPPSQNDLKKLQSDIIQSQNKEMVSQLEKLKTEYVKLNAPEHILKGLEDAISKIDITGVRVIE